MLESPPNTRIHGASALRGRTLRAPPRAIAACVLFLASIGPAPPARAEDTQRAEVLVLHSYAFDYDWTRSEQAGIDAVLKPFADAYDVRVEYLDAARSPDLVRGPLIRQLYRDKFAGSRLRVILASDNAAFDFLRAHGDEIFPRVPVVFMGVNGYEDAMIEGLDRFTGVAEDNDFLGVFEAALRLQPRTRRIVVPGPPDDATYQGNAALIRKLLPRFRRDVAVEFPSCPHVEACIDLLRALPGDTIALIVGNPRTAGGQGVDNRRAVEMISAAVPLPLYTAWDFSVGNGAVGGSVMTGSEQGRLAAEIALRVLRGERPRDIPVHRNAGNTLMFDHRQLVRFGLRPADLPPGALVINSPDPTYRISRETAWTALCSLVALAAAVLALTVNVRRRKRAEADLKRANRQLEDIVEFLPDATVVVDRDKKVVAWNRATVEMTGIPPADMIGRDHVHAGTPFYGAPRPLLVALTDASDAELGAHYSYVQRSGRVLHAEAFKPALRAGEGAFVSATASALLDGEGRFAGAIGSIRDITDRKRAEEAVREANERFRSILDAATAYAIIGTDPDGRIQVFNVGAERMLGYPAREVVDRKTVLIIHEPAELAARAAELGMAPGFDVLAAAARLGETETREWTYVRKDGGRLTVSLTVAPMHGEDRALTGFIGIARDITGEKMLERQLVQSQKMETVGLLAGGIAHDFNNLLTPIISYADVLRLELPPEDDRQEWLRGIGEAARRASDLTRQLLALGRRQMLELRIVDLGYLLRRFETMLRRTIEEHIRIELAMAEGLGAVRADAGQIEQVLLNLAVNARDAMPTGGTLSIAASNVLLDDGGTCRHPELKPGAYVRLEVSDTGNGMTEEVQHRLFEPFFTTKEMGKGSGLGLSTAYGIVKQHGGSISVRSQLGHGSTFQVLLPRAAEPPDAAVALDEAPVTTVRGTETVLVVEDNDIVRSLACDLLRRLGYRVLAADGGESALRLSDELEGEIHLLLTDVVLPKMNGKEIATRLVTKRPALKVLYMSGYASDCVVHHGVVDEGVNFLQKPLSLESLSRKVRTVLDS